ncbi:MAG: CpsD/CapB family tyrosine-protein kinase [Gammaproteobacteria bacterium]|nr:CpsD/CapB family tyrosine-protein kinase [Gammaproteobacteria bacterium]
MDRITKAVERTRQEKETALQPGDVLIGNTQDASEISRIEVSQELLRQNRIFLGSEAGDYAHAYKVLRTRVWHQMRTNGWHSLGVTSANPGEGKTLTATNLAISLARMEIGRKVVLVDLDMRRPSVHRYLGFRPEYGISDFLLSGMSLGKILVDIGIERFAVLPGCASFANSSEILSSGRMVQLMNEIKRYFPSRVVIFDLPPILAADDVLVVAPHINAFLLVIEEGRSPAKDVGKAAELLKDSNIVGTVLNKTPEAVQQYYGY